MANSVEDYSESQFVAKLTTLNASQTCIEEISQWVFANRKHVKSIAKVWYKEFKSAESKKKMPYLFLLNDICQSTRKKAPEFVKVFSPVVSHAVKEIQKTGGSKNNEAMRRMVDIWRERKVFEPEVLLKADGILGRLSGNSHEKKHKSKAKAVTGVATATGTDDVPSPPQKKDEPMEEEEEEEQSQDDVANLLDKPQARPIATIREELAADLAREKADDKAADLEQVLTDLTYLSNAPSANADTRQRIATFPLHISEEASVDSVRAKSECMMLEDQVNEADSILVAYNVELEEETKRRQMLQNTLKQLRGQQVARLEESKRRLEEVKLKLDAVKAVRGELNSHLANLPDLSLLPDVTGGLAPLPSVGDLFG